MKRLTAFLALSSLLTINYCVGQETKELMKLADFTFESFFGNSSKDQKDFYSLLGTGFSMRPQLGNSDSVIVDWIKRHPDAIVIPISSLGPKHPKTRNSRMIYCWVVDKTDTLNNYLIKTGCFLSGTMDRPKTWEEMEQWEKELYNDPREMPDVKVFVDKITYDTFIEQIMAAELYARENKLGIWQNDHDE